MIKTLLLDTFLLMGIIWMLISIVYFCIRMDRLLSSMEKTVVETREETAEVVLSEEDISSSSVHSDFNSFEDYRNRFLHTSRFPRKTAFTMNVETLQVLRNILHDLNQRVSMTSYIENILREHLREHQNLINDAADKQRSKTTITL
ncbi:conjugal transfer protein TraC [Prevotella sp. HMSC069G02]|nr:conjugal transfer protein TraC [Prevotella sp. HMSC069G02]